MELLGSGLPVIIADEEPLVRVLVNRAHLRKNRTIKPHAFMPNPKYNNTSVYRHDGTQSESLELIKEKASNSHTPPRDCRGIAVIISEDVRQSSLEVTHDEPPDFHANIEGWSAEDEGRNKLLAMGLAEKASLVV